MDRRDAFKAGLAAGIGVLAGGAADAATAPAGVPRVVYHLADIDKIAFVMGNIRNHFIGMGGPDKVHLAIVIHGPPLKAFTAGANDPTVKSDFAKLVGTGLEPYACINTMKAMHIAKEDLLPGFGIADKGGVVKLAQLQGQGYAYLRP